jgi:hypothetical protein
MKNNRMRLGDIMNAKFLIVILLFSMLVFSGCSAKIPAQYKDDVCASTCYIKLQKGMDPKAIDFYKENKALFEQVEKPMCRNYRDIGVSEKDIDAYFCNEIQTGVESDLTACNGCDTFCDCKLKDGRYLIPSIYDLLSQIDKEAAEAAANAPEGNYVGTMNSEYFLIKIPSDIQSINKLTIPGTGSFNTDATNSVLNLTIFAFDVSNVRLSDDKSLRCFIDGEEEVKISDMLKINEKTIIYGPKLIVGYDAWNNVEFSPPIVLTTGYKYYIKISGIDMYAVKSSSTENNYYYSMIIDGQEYIYNSHEVCALRTKAAQNVDITIN